MEKTSFSASILSSKRLSSNGFNIVAFVASKIRATSYITVRFKVLSSLKINMFIKGFGNAKKSTYVSGYITQCYMAEAYRFAVLLKTRIIY